MQIAYRNEAITGEIKPNCEFEVLKAFSEAMPARKYQLIDDEYIIAEMINSELVYFDWRYFC